MIPFATGEKKWTHQQLGNAEPQALLVPLRRAEAALGDPRYETAVRKLGADVSRSRDALLFPAIQVPDRQDEPATLPAEPGRL